MRILIKPTFLKDSKNSWETKVQGVILVPEKANITPLWKALVKQDADWKDYKHLIQVAPKEINSLLDIEKMCDYTGKTAIYNTEVLRDDFDFILFQYREDHTTNRTYV